MVNATVTELRKQSEAAWEKLGGQLEGMEAHMERSHADGEWTARQVLCHLLFEPGFDPVPLLRSFHAIELPLIEVTPGVATVTPERQRMTLAEFVAALDAQRRAVFEYLETLDPAGLERKARIPIFKPLIGTDEITLPIFVGALFGRHWSAHADQLAQIRRAVGLPEPA